MGIQHSAFRMSLYSGGYTEVSAMNVQRMPTILTMINLGILLFLLNEVRPVNANTEPPVLRGRALEIVDSQGRLRASIQVIPEGPARRSDGSLAEPSGIVHPEAVVL